jgi:uncharacterized membrane protein YedE/YeeE
MLAKQTEPKWRPYLAGSLAGLLAIASAYATTKLMDKTTYLGASTTFVRAAGMIECRFWPERVNKNTYFQKEKIKVDWQFALVCGIFFGALAGSLMGRTFEWNEVPERFAKRFHRRPFLRMVLAFIGGVIAMFGARLADGCPSGHGLSGVMQLSVSGLVALACFFLGGAIAAHKIYGEGVPHD